MTVIDLRSDTVTQPTDAMRQAMATAEVGDDVLDEDPTLHRLQDMAAEKLGKEAALFLPSGTMGNLVSLLTHCQRGDEVILGERSHIFINEVGGLSAVGGIHPHTVPNEADGTLDLERLQKAIRHSDLHYPPTRLICLENTHNYCHGSPLPLPYMKSVAALARDHGLKLHVDGARIFNAAVALKVDVKDLAAEADSVMFSLSKGLSAPVGSLICGTGEWVRNARKWRKMLGGGMRQAGHLAAAGITALENQVERLADDHQNAHTLAVGLAGITGLALDPAQVKTNIVFFQIKHPQITPDQFLKRLHQQGVQVLLIEQGLFRAVLNRHVSAENVDATLKIIKEILN